MTYKDPDKQREAVKAATRRYRNRLKVSRNEGITEEMDRVSRDDSLRQPSPLRQVESFATVDVIIEPQSHNPMMVGYVPPED